MFFYLINFVSSVISTHPVNSVTFVDSVDFLDSMRYDDAVVQEFSQIAGVETKTYSSGLEYAPIPFVGWFEYAHLQNDTQL